jgi:lactate dehydrogenase-like 2-hydroxyacid dehydrogenase
VTLIETPAIVVTRRWPESVERDLAASFADVRFNEADVPLGEHALRDALYTCDALLPSVSDRITTDMLLEKGVRTRFIGNFGVGFSNIDIEAARRAGIVVTNTPGILTDATADLAMTLLLMVARRAGEGERHVRDGAWTGWRPTHMLGSDVTGRTLGILGMGRIGAAVACRARNGFGMPVVWYGGASDHGVEGARRMETMDAVLRQSDFVSLHMPGGGNNAHLIGERELAVMRPTAFLINTARGDVVDSQALAKALANGTIAGAGLDVFEREPDIDPGLLGLENVVLLPHLGSATLGTRTAMGNLVVRNLKAFVQGEEPPCRVA